LLPEFARIAQADFSDIVTSVQFIHHHRASLAEKLRLYLRDSSFVVLWVDSSGSRYSFHWEHRARRGLMYRHDNAPDFPTLSTAPKHFHNGSESQVEDSHLSDDLKTALREFLDFVRAKLAEFGG